MNYESAIFRVRELREVDACSLFSMYSGSSSSAKYISTLPHKELTSNHAEIKSMRTATSSRNQGVASQLLSHVVAVAKTRNYEFLSLETGSMDYFLAARKLYEKHGFIYCGPFGDYQPDPNSCFMTRKL
ncbi:GNAT family N-acetyltransferase [Vibrio navarrensis]|uniref:GNAT family N-acetyltransferase n=1 Tax=Vibrio navarrensis TaxID=29495 RepID=UPI0018DC0C5E|nr:GNAT family N-acetyltransferase [Vibrio navarrensis]MBH9742494.1 hypothetical protein [Vibrio navarrensis]